ncbi:hypothetical protein ZIOFF_071966 [Zingiber officinale]|uniref:ARM repeat superfamily protein n=1 Tax=Zingiber officinale TaxID=94328 RepID=A0A8J5CV19_ZINOF|nr:hypothetical protein ZIOFF_071966 [Zingiber officinale]
MLLYNREMPSGVQVKGCAWVDFRDMGNPTFTMKNIRKDETAFNCFFPYLWPTREGSLSLCRYHIAINKSRIWFVNDNIGVAHCLGELYRLFGRRVTSGLTETINIAAKLMKFNEDFVRKDALQMLDNALEGCGGSGPFTAYSEAHRIVMRVGVTDKSFIVRLAAARCLKTFANIDSPGLGPAELEGSIVYCLKALVDPTSSVRDAFAEALGGLLALATNPEAQVKRGNKITVPAQKLEDNLQKHFILPFVKGKDLNACCHLSVFLSCMSS